MPFIEDYFRKANAERRAGRAARGPLARQTQSRLDELQKLMKKCYIYIYVGICVQT